MKWNIYYADREYAREKGDPVLGTILIADHLPFSEAKALAEWLAVESPSHHITDRSALLWAWPAPDPRKEVTK